MATHRVIAQPAGGTAGAELVTNLRDPAWDTFRCAVAFAKAPGVRHVAPDLRAFVLAGGQATVSIGISRGGTSLEGLGDLWRILDGHGQLYVFHEGRPGSIFHPKLYLFRNPTHARVVVGSSNLTQGGLYRNHEIVTVDDLDLSDPDDVALLAPFEDALDLWQTVSPACLTVTPSLMAALHRQGDLPREGEPRHLRRTSAFRRATGTSGSPSVTFGDAGAYDPAPEPGPFPAGLPDPPVVP